MSITKETRQASYLERPVCRQEQIMEIFRQASGPLTARQVLHQLGIADMNSARPRITELLKAGRIKAACKVKDGTTGNMVAAFVVNHHGK